MLRLATPVMNIAQEPEPCLLPTICRSPSTSLRSSATSSTHVQGSSVPQHEWIGRGLALSTDRILWLPSASQGTIPFANLLYDRQCPPRNQDRASQPWASQARVSHI